MKFVSCKVLENGHPPDQMIRPCAVVVVVIVVSHSKRGMILSAEIILQFVINKSIE